MPTREVTEARAWQRALANGGRTLLTRLMRLDVGNLAISDYSARYLRQSLAVGPAILGIHQRILELAFPDEGSARRAVFVDYGGGTGLLALLARAAGVGTVVYNDIYSVSCTDAATIAHALGLAADAYVEGDLPTFRRRLATLGLQADAVGSYDVIEHVYDAAGFLRDLADVSEGPLRLVLASSANGHNPYRRRRLVSIQRRLEWVGSAGESGHKPRDTLRAYRALRAEIIRRAAPQLAEARVLELVRRSRGMARWDIEAAIARYTADGIAPEEPSHPTNTCDPETGNWAEQLLDPSRLAHILCERGMDARVEPGRYGRHAGVKGVATALLNAAIKVLGARGLVVAPYYVVIARRDAPLLASPGGLHRLPDQPQSLDLDGR